MKLHTSHLTLRPAFVLGLVLAGAAVLEPQSACAQTNAPGLTIALLPDHQLRLSLTNTTLTNYAIYRRETLSPICPWTLSLTGAVGQITFTNAMQSPSGFFQARVGYDWDGDGILNWEDADPLNAGVGYLTITILSPANGSTLD